MPGNIFFMRITANEIKILQYLKTTKIADITLNLRLFTLYNILVYTDISIINSNF